MPVLHFRVKDGSPYIRTSRNHDEEGVIFPVWSTDDYALRVFENLRIGDKGKIDWGLFFQLKDEDHIIPGGGGAPEVHPNDIEHAQMIQELRNKFFMYALEGELEDAGELEELFQNVLLLIQRVPRGEFRNQHYLSLAERINDLQNHGGKVQVGYGQRGRDALIRRVPGELRRNLQAFFHLTDDEWHEILNTGIPLHADPLGSVPDTESVDRPLAEERCAVGGLDQVGDLLRFAYDQERLGFEVELFVRSKENPVE
ncbi:MAG: hypothetical protein WAN16_09500 [Chthoniobacterales bacterium]